MLAAKRNAGTQTILAFYSSSEGGFRGQLLILSSIPQVSNDFPSEDKLHRAQKAKQPDAKACKTGSRIDGGEK